VVDWLALFDRENVQFAILDLRTDGDLVGMLRRQCRWIVDFEDKETVMFTRRSG
jgi:hypothetical protein